MGGHSCCIFGCSACQTRNKGLSFHLIPKNEPWHTQMMQVITRDRADQLPKKPYICSRHFDESAFKPFGNGRILVEGSLPTKFLPERQHQSITNPRKPPMQRPEPALPERLRTFGDICSEVQKMPPGWGFAIFDNSVKITLMHGCIPKLVVDIDPDMKATVYVFSIFSHKESLTERTLHNFIKSLEKKSICPGVTNPELQNFAELPAPGLSFYRHIIPNGAQSHSSSIRASSCSILQDKTGTCKACTDIEVGLKKKKGTKEERTSQGIKKKTPLSVLSAEQLKAEVLAQRRINNDLKRQLEKLTSNSSTIQLEREVHDGLLSSLEEGINNISDPLAILFWQEQKKAFLAKERGMRWHPMLLRLAIMLRCMSPGAYRLMRDIGVLHLPGESTLKDYTNVLSPSQGFNPRVLNCLAESVKCLKSHERFVVLLHDEMTIKDDLVFDRRTGEMVGFVNPNTWSVKDALATHVLVFMVVGLSTNIKMTIGFFSTRTATSDEIFPLLWQAIYHLETRCGLKVLASCSDKATPNQRLYRLHGAGEEICYKAKNIFAKDRFLYFISDAPHLIKTIRNNLASSGFGNNTRYLWNNDHHLLWNHIVDLYRRDTTSHLRRTCLTADHVFLTPFNVMKVKLAAQVLSETMSKVMLEYGSDESTETAKFIGLVDKFFDCLNTRHCDEGGRKLKPYLAPYTSTEDERFDFLLNTFLKYIEDWRASVLQRPGFTKQERNKMFLSNPTYEGIYITVHSFIEATRYALDHGVEYVLSQRFCQDALEEHFGRQRGMGGCADNPNLWKFGYQEQALHQQRELMCMMKPRGNITQKRAAMQTIHISNEPLEKKKR